MQNPQFKRKFTAAAMSAVLAAGMIPSAAFAQPAAAETGAGEGSPATLAAQAIASGEWGDATWSLGDDGTLEIKGEQGADCWDTSEAPWYTVRDKVTSIVAMKSAGARIMLPARCLYLFAEMPNLTTVDLSGADFSGVLDTVAMFQNDAKLESFDLGATDMDSIMRMGSMFAGCTSLKTADLGGKVLFNATDMANMFKGCTSLETASLANTDTENNRALSGMFDGCGKLTKADLTGFRTDSVENFTRMFTGCDSLATLDLSSWDTSSGTKTDKMFPDGIAWVKVGTGFDFTKCADLPSGGEYAEPWYSLGAGKWLSAGEIARDRNKTADTYTKTTDAAKTDIGAATAYAKWPKRVYPDSTRYVEAYLMYDGKVLGLGIDYVTDDQEYISDGAGHLSEYRFTAAGITTYSGEARFSVKLNTTPPEGKYDLGDGDAEAFVEYESTPYDGTEKKPDYDLEHMGVRLAEGTDYTAEYKNNIGPGTGKIMFTGIGNYTGTYTAEFGIAGKTLSGFEASAANAVYDGTEQKPAVKVTDGETVLAEGADYTVAYSDNIAAGTGKTTVTGKGAYSGTLETTFKIAPADISKASVETPHDTYKYTGKPLSPSPTVRFGGKTLVEGTDYTLSYGNNIEKGSATVTATGQGNYTGSASGTFAIATEGADVDNPDRPGDTIACDRMYRLFNRATGEHLYTKDAYERDVLRKGDWNYEGIGWYAPRKSGVPVYRLYNTITGDHLYTKDAYEKDVLSAAEWNYEGIGWYSAEGGGFENMVPVYREYKPYQPIGSHNFTTDGYEHRYLCGHGWNDEGIAWYGVPEIRAEIG